MELHEFGADDADAVRRFVGVSNAVREADAPFENAQTEHEAAGIFRYGWDLEPPVPFLLDVDGVTVGLAEYSVSHRDNLHLAWLTVEVHPAHRRRGHGSVLLDAMVERARRDGRTSVGIGGWESPTTTGFAAHHGLEQRYVEAFRRQIMAELDWATLDTLHDEALTHAASYELVRRLGPTPADELEAMAAMVAAINDAPTDELDIEDEVFSPERIRAYEAAMAGRRIVAHKVFARHRGTGELAGETIVGVDLERPHLAEQHDTSVVAAHRGHRLGLLLKIEMLRWLRETQPQVASIDTWNAVSNDHMVGVNEALGYRMLRRGVAYQRAV